MAEEVTSEAIGAVLNGILKSARDELAGMASADLERFWFFEWDESRSAVWNTYMFTRRLDLYGSQCRRWEEMHNGHCCVVERVRDTYLMPKIKVFVARMTATPTPKG
jgi:hypothetical protein